VAEYEYDGLNRRTLKKTYSGGSLSETRHLYYSDAWQVLEERVGSSTEAERQFVWGVRHVDDLVLRDWDADADGSLEERLYALQDGNWSVTALADSAGDVQERFAYDAYGLPSVLTAAFGARGSSLSGWETRYAGYRWDAESGLQQVRLRHYHAALGEFLTRDPLGTSKLERTLYGYAGNMPLTRVDPVGAGFEIALRPPQPLVWPGLAGVGAALLNSAGTAGAAIATVTVPAGVAVGTVAVGVGAVGYLTWELGDALVDLWKANARGKELDKVIFWNQVRLFAREAAVQKAAEALTAAQIGEKCARLSRRRPIVVEDAEPQRVIRGRGKCNFLFAVCFWIGTQQRARRVLDRCLRCYNECIRSRGRWPFDLCPMSTADILQALREKNLL
jgi:RHS repeat-associated protein